VAGGWRQNLKPMPHLTGTHYGCEWLRTILIQPSTAVRGVVWNKSCWGRQADVCAGTLANLCDDRNAHESWVSGSGGRCLLLKWGGRLERWRGLIRSRSGRQRA
jgi:hypothetical protein